MSRPAVLRDTARPKSRSRPSLAGINANLVVALHALLEEPNVSAAARSVGLGQSSMSYALARLRAHFQDPLLVRHGKQTVLTRLAKSLVGPVRAAIIQLETVFAGASSFDPATTERTFQIASTDNIELILLPRLVKLLREEAPCVDVRVFPLMEGWRTALRNGELDLKLGRSYDPGPGLLHREILRERFVGVVRDGHPVKARRISLEEYAGMLHVRICPTPGIYDTVADLIDVQLRAKGLSRRVAVSVPHFLVAPFVVASSDLILTAPERVVEALRRPLKLRVVTPALPEPSYGLSEVWSEHTEGDPAQLWFRGLIRRAVEGL